MKPTEGNNKAAQLATAQLPNQWRRYKRRRDEGSAARARTAGGSSPHHLPADDTRIMLVSSEHALAEMDEKTAVVEEICRPARADTLLMWGPRPQVVAAPADCQEITLMLGRHPKLGPVSRETREALLSQRASTSRTARALSVVTDGLHPAEAPQATAPSYYGDATVMRPASWRPPLEA